MLEILYNEKGEVIVAKKKPCVWGREETQVKDLEDNDLETYMTEKGKSFMVLPYKTMKLVVSSKTMSGQNCPVYACEGMIDSEGYCSFCKWNLGQILTDEKSKYKVNLATVGEAESLTFTDLI